jgi:N utilization substance protein B
VPAARTKARTRAFQILFEADQRGVSPQSVLAEWIGRARQPQPDDGTPQVSEYTMQLVEGYAQHARRIDELIATYAVGWTLDRMPVVDRNVLRLGAYELLWQDDVPDAVVLDEVVQIAKEFSGDEAPAFVNGLLGRLKELKPSLRGARD